MLTEAAVQRLKAPEQGRREVRDARGLFLKISAKGHRSWLYRFRRGDRTVRITLGPLDDTRRDPTEEPKVGQPLTLVEARVLASRMTADRARGTDLQREHRARRRGWTSPAPTGTDSFLATLREYIRERPKTRTWHEVSMALGLREGDEVARDSVADRWRDHKIGEITNDDVFVILEECRTRGTPGRRMKGTGAARHRAMVKTLAAFFEWAVERRKVASNVARGFKVEPIPERERVLSDKELRAVWRALDAAPLPYARAFRVMIYTGQRRTEVGSMRWDEVDGSTWTIPPERMKGKRAHIVHLTAPVLAMLDEVPRVEGCGFIFTVDGRKPIASWANAKRAVEGRAAIAPWTLHDFRRTAITWWYENGVAPHVVEAIVAHRYHRSGVAGRYNFAGYAEARKEAMERWTAHVLALV